MFNILVIVALSAAVAGKSGASLAIDYRPVTRDVCFYSYSILLLAVFFTDGVIEMWEALIMWLSYLLYIGFMTINEKVLKYCKPPTSESYKVSPEDEEAADAAAKALGGDKR
jgi:sodium/potassium/calcium exchanger 3/sodium/potassium/calcium exchanger 4